MGWEEIAKKLGESIERRRVAEMGVERQKKEEARRREEEYERVVKEFSPRVKEVCKFFAKSIKGKLYTNDDPRSNWYGHDAPQHSPPTEFAVTGPEDKQFRTRCSCRVSITRDGIGVSTYFITLGEFTEDKLGEALGKSLEVTLSKWYIDHRRLDAK